MGEIHDVRGDLGRPYAARAISEVVVGESTAIDGEPAVTMRVADADVLDPAVEGLAPGESITAVTHGITLEHGSELQVYLGRWSDTVLQVSYAIDPGTDLPAPGFDGDLPDGTPQVEVLECLSEGYGVRGAHRHAEALARDVAADADARLLDDCLDTLQDW